MNEKKENNNFITIRIPKLLVLPIILLALVVPIGLAFAGSTTDSVNLAAMLPQQITSEYQEIIPAEMAETSGNASQGGSTDTTIKETSDAGKSALREEAAFQKKATAKESVPVQHVDGWKEDHSYQAGTTPESSTASGSSKGSADNVFGITPGKGVSEVSPKGSSETSPEKGEVKEK